MSAVRLRCAFQRWFPASIAVLGMLSCTDFTAPLPPPDQAARNSVAQTPGDVFVVLQTDPDDTPDAFAFTHDFGGNSSPQVASPFTLRDGRLEIFNSVVPGSYTLSHVATAAWHVVASGDGYESGCWDDQGNSSIDLSSGVATIDVSPGEFVVCTFVLARRATLNLQKRENGALPLSRPWSFELRSGASTTTAGVVHARGVADVSTGEVTFSCVADDTHCGAAGGVTYFNAQQYQLCETGMPARTTNNVAGFAPAGSAAEGEAHGAECVNVTLSVAQAATTSDVLGVAYVNNVIVPENPAEPEPPAPSIPRLDSPRGSGSWKNSGSCAAHGHSGRSSGTLLDAYLANSALYPLGIITALTCEQAVRLLGKQDFSGHQKGGDAGYALAGQLLGARLNGAAGAPLPVCVESAMAAAQALLQDAQFSGTGDYLTARLGSKAVRGEALALAELLGRYNDGEPAILAGDC